MGVRSQRPRPLPAPALTPLGTPISNSVGGPASARGPGAGGGGTSDQEEPTHPGPPRTAFFSSSAVPEPSPRPSSEGQTDQGGGPSSSWPCGAIWSEGHHPHPDPRLLRAPSQLPALEAGYRHPREAPRGDGPVAPPLTAGVLSAPCPQTHLPRFVPSPVCPTCVAQKVLELGAPAASLPALPALPS